MIIIAHDEQDGVAFLNIYKVEHVCQTDEDAISEIRKQLKEWSKTDEGQGALEETCNDFNWGDLDDWKKLIQWESPIISVTEEWCGSGTAVEHDELLLGELK